MVLVPLMLLPVVGIADTELYKAKQAEKKALLIKAYTHDYYENQVESLVFQTLKYETYLLGRGFVDSDAFISSKATKDANVQEIVFNIYQEKVKRDLGINLSPVSLLKDLK